jgi:transcriptional regulator GlxA family with amidase domain
MDVRVHKVITLLELNLQQVLKPKDIAHAINLSLPRLRSLFRAETGQPLARYQKSLRMRKARKLLEDSSLNVKQILLNVGIFDESHFVKDFKKAYGLPPTQYRARCRRERDSSEALRRDEQAG